MSARIGHGGTEASAPAERIRYDITACSLGQLLVAASDRGVCAILLGDGVDELQLDLTRRFPQADLVRDPEAVASVMESVLVGVESGSAIDGLDLDLRGTEFQRRVWRTLAGTPAGSTASYREIAQGLDMPSATRAVAGACGANSLAVVVPCHRVVRSDGSLSGYRWGVERKRELLRREREAAKQAGRAPLPTN